MTPAGRIKKALDAARCEILSAVADLQNVAPDKRKVPFGDFIRENREALGLSLQELADKAGCTKSHIWEIEANRSVNPTVHTVQGLAKGLGIPVMSVFSAALRVKP